MELGTGANVVREALVTNVDRKSTLVTDESSLYTKVGKEFAGHETMIHSGREYVNKNGYTTNNVEASQILLEACVGRPLTRFVYASSSSVYGDRAVIPMREDALPQPVSPYGVTKLAAEQLCYHTGIRGLDELPMMPTMRLATVTN